MLFFVPDLGRKAKAMDKKTKQGNLAENLFIVILTFYPLRHINWGLDLWDTGYNYSNFRYMGTEHMDSMWLFSTYLSNVVGNFLMKLPSAGSLVGMNFYTGLFAGLLAVMGYFFCTRKLKMPRWIAFIGEHAALSLCWCPTALLYNYLTYVLFLICVILLYQGLTEEKPICLVLAGICLGANVLVRFSNLPEMAMIVAVWVYDVLVWYRAGKDRSKHHEESLWRRLGQHTFWCLVGYGSSLLVLFGYINFRYGFGNYVAGIKRLFAMTDNAADYKAGAMIRGMFDWYIENMYWVIRIGVILVGGMVLIFLAELLRSGQNQLIHQKESQNVKEKHLEAGIRVFAGILSLAIGILLYFQGFWSLLLQRKVTVQQFGMLLLVFIMMLSLAYCAGDKVFSGLLGTAMLAWLYFSTFCSTEFLHNGPIQYGPMQRPGILFLMLTLLICLIRFLHRDSTIEEKLISVMVVIVVMVTPLGSNNKLMPALNNLFTAAPYTLWQSYRFLKNVKEKHLGKTVISAYPAKGLLTAFLLMCLFQFGGFGLKFAFAEATGVYDLTATVENNEILRNIKMSPEKAQLLTELSGYAEEHRLQGREVILYGWVPSLAYYLQMPPAFNSWSDLTSYSYETMAEAIAKTEEGIRERGEEKPIVIVDYLHTDQEQDKKWMLILDFMGRNGYEPTWQNDRFAIYE